ncbi:hypothetical protein KY495_01385 [Massilia sp. PAMC28688]|uniref:FIST signal transduction protein n=1 Tax=Massilia sp. PAMC28688 TaxID=2861283 RepID=UPI001C62D7DB|nr:FIST N-terminal domain-containing protein [Massilia sp. PAMC28688]QYF93922.1 hypothetical protein KY495_01385 [Massilia sp. PAMC28688]
MPPTSWPSCAGAAPDALIVFMSPMFDYRLLLQALREGCTPGVMVGCSSAGEFSGAADANASVSVLAIAGDDMRFNAAIGRGVDHDRDGAIAQIMPVFTGASHPDLPYRSALVLTDALAGHTDELIHEITVKTGGAYQLFGGGAADDARFQQTHVFIGTEAHDNAVVVLEMLSKRPLGLGVSHGWEPGGPPLRVTEAEGNRIISLNAIATGRRARRPRRAHRPGL